MQIEQQDVGRTGMVRPVVESADVWRAHAPTSALAAALADGQADSSDLTREQLVRVACLYLLLGESTSAQEALREAEHLAASGAVRMTRAGIELGGWRFPWGSELEEAVELWAAACTRPTALGAELWDEIAARSSGMVTS